MSTRILIISIVFIFFVGVIESFNIADMLTVRNCSISGKSAANRQISQVMLRFYTGKTANEFYTVPLNQSMKIVQHEQFNKSRCIVVYIFGFETRPSDAATVRVVNAYLETNKYNLVLVDWSEITINNAYNVAVSLMAAIAPDIAKAIDTMLNSSVELCHLAGHSLGAQCAGAVARSMKHRVQHIIALDPAGPLFYLPLKCAKALSKDDADCVEVIRTDAGGLGAPPVVSVGKIDYFVNGGTRSQPNCTDVRVPNPKEPNVQTGCSHNRALSIMAGAIRNFVDLIAVRCSSWHEFLTGTCRQNIQMAIGNCSSSSQAGIYFLRTNSTEPYGKGLDGIQPPKNQTSTKATTKMMDEIAPGAGNLPGSTTKRPVDVTSPRTVTSSTSTITRNGTLQTMSPKNVTLSTPSSTGMVGMTSPRSTK